MDRCLAMSEVNHVMTCLSKHEIETAILCLNSYVWDREYTGELTDELVDSINSIVDKLTESM